MLKTPICDELGIKYPIFLAGMGGVSMAELVAAVSNAGGMGFLGAAVLDAKGLKEEIKKVRSLTDKPFAIDLLMPMGMEINPIMKVIYESGVKGFVAGLSVPTETIKECKKNGIKVFCMIGKVKHALKAVEAGSDYVVAQGTEAEGHTGNIATMALVPQVVDAVNLPVIAAGGIADGRGLVASLALGAQGVVIGTRFIATKEARGGKLYKDELIKATEDDTIISRSGTGKTMRMLKTDYVMEWERDPKKIAPFPQQAMITLQRKAMNFIATGEVQDPKREVLPAGQITGMIKDVRGAGEIMKEIVAQAEEILKNNVTGMFRKEKAKA